MKTQVFVSYCHDDLRQDDVRLRAFTDALKRNFRAVHELVVDFEHPDAAVGANIPQFMRRISTADVVVVILTPSYKSRVVSKRKSGAWDEFQLINDRLRTSEQANSYGKDFLVLPVILSGTFTDSCPVEFEHLHCHDVTWLYTTPKTNAPPTVHPSLKSKLRRTVAEINAKIDAVAATKGVTYERGNEDAKQSFLFQDTKSRWDLPENHRYIKPAFVRTATFERALARDVSFIVGRKGAGKSSVTHVLPLKIDPLPVVVLRIDFEQLPFDMCFNVLKGRPAEASDLRHAFSAIYSYELLWDAFFHLFLAWHLRDEIGMKSHLRTNVFRDLAAATRHENESKRDETVTRVLFVYAFEKLVEFVDSVMRRREGDYLARSVAEFTQSSFRAFVFGNAWPILHRVLKHYRQINARLLITVDGFDVQADYFIRHKHSDERLAAMQFETELLLALFQIALKTHRGGAAHGIFYEITDLCVAIPHDRFLQVRAADRDRYRYRHLMARLEWTGMELSALVRKRLVVARQARDPKGPSLEERLAAVMSSSYPELPDEIVFQFGAARYRMALFIYVLRHTFWRPRDVLFFYAALLLASKRARKKGEKVPDSFVRQVVAGATRYIVNYEFIAEYTNAFHNLREVLLRFKRGPQVMSWAKMEERLKDMRFDTPVPEGEVASLEWKVETLYEIGAMGVLLDRTTAERCLSFRHAFVFNEGHLLTEKLVRDDYPSLQFILHPVLVEYLQLDTLSNPELILPIDWEYLHSNEELRQAMSG